MGVWPHKQVTTFLRQWLELSKLLSHMCAPTDTWIHIKKINVNFHAKPVCHICLSSVVHMWCSSPLVEGFCDEGIFPVP